MDAIKEDVRAYWEKEAVGFDQEFGHGLRNDQHKEIWLNILRRNIPPHKPLRILDIGCGTGFLALLLSELGHTVTGLDFASQMLAVAGEKVRTMNLQIDYHQGDAENPPFPPNSFDHIICRHLIWTLPHPNRAIASWKELLAPEGAVTLIEGHWRGHGVRAKARRCFAAVVQILEQRRLPKAWEKSYVRNRDDLPLFGGRPAGVLANLLVAAGFSDVRKDDLVDLLENENQSAPLSFRIRHSGIKERRFLLQAKK